MGLVVICISTHVEAITQVYDLFAVTDVTVITVACTPRTDKACNYK